MRIRCPKCRKAYEAQDGLPAAVRVRCANCDAVFSLSEGLGDSAGPTGAAATDTDALPLALDAPPARPPQSTAAPTALDEIAAQINGRPVELTTMRLRHYRRR